MFQRTAGVDAVLDVVRSRSGTHFDPQIAQLVATDPESLFVDLDSNTADEVLAAEPVDRAALTDDESTMRCSGDRGFLRSLLPVLRRTRSGQR